MPELIQPSSAEELAEAVRSAPRVIAVGAGTKSRLSQVGPDYVRISTAKLRGIIDYEPSEFTFTALAGTPLREITDTLARSGQYLPFDPPFVDTGATLGGTVCAGLSGAGRFRFGGLRDFILGVRFVDGEGRLLRLGGRVVKNAAGFDIPKFFVGSAGRFGALAEITFKVFPRATATRTLRIRAADTLAKAKILMDAAGTRWELDALEASLTEPAVFARMAGPPGALDALTAEILGRWAGVALPGEEANALWKNVGGVEWAHADGILVKLALAPAQVPDFAAVVSALPGARGWIGAGGNAGYLSLPSGAELPPLVWPAVTLRGHAPLWPGPKRSFEVMARVKAALDPQNRFPALHDT